MPAGWTARWRSPGPASAILLLLFGFLLGVGIVQERLREEQLPTTAAELRALIHSRRGAVEELAARVRALSEGLEELQVAQAEGSGTLQEVLARLEALRRGVGLEPLSGPGVMVILEDSARAAGSPAEAADLRIQDVDLRLVVNALWRAGAEAVAVNGQRVVATTAIRRAGSAVLVNYHAVESPYRVVALGSPDALERGLGDTGLIRQFEIWGEVYGLGFQVLPSEALKAPALAAGPAVRWGDPGGGGHQP